MEFENTSGQGKRAAVPAEIKKWNWGAFFLHVLWGIPNRVFISFLVLIPPLTVIMPFVLGAKGNEWAWTNKKWESVERFQQTQKAWTVGGAIAGVGILVSIVYLVWFLAFSPLAQFAKQLTQTVAETTSVSVIPIDAPPYKPSLPAAPTSTEGWTTHVSTAHGYSILFPASTFRVKIREGNADWIMPRDADSHAYLDIDTMPRGLAFDFDYFVDSAIQRAARDQESIETSTIAFLGYNATEIYATNNELNSTDRIVFQTEKTIYVIDRGYNNGILIKMGDKAAQRFVKPARWKDNETVDAILGTMKLLP